MMRLKPKHEWLQLESMTRAGHFHRGVAAAIGPDRKRVVVELGRVPALKDFPPGILPLMASFLGPEIVLLAGGTDRGERLPTVCSSLEDNVAWECGFAVNPARQFATATVVGDQMLVCGGIWANTFTALAKCKAFDPASNCWFDMPPMSTPRAAHCAAEWQGRTLVFGGDGEPPIASCESYDPTLLKWSALTPMKSGRSQAAAVVVPGSGILVMGGSGVGQKCLQTAELYDPATNSWIAVPWMLPEPVMSFSAHCHDSKLYIAGGWTNSGPTADCWFLDLAIDSPAWTPLPPLPIPLCGMASVLV